MGLLAEAWALRGEGALAEENHPDRDAEEAVRCLTRATDIRPQNETWAGLLRDAGALLSAEDLQGVLDEVYSVNFPLPVAGAGPRLPGGTGRALLQQLECLTLAEEIAAAVAESARPSRAGSEAATTGYHGCEEGRLGSGSVTESDGEEEKGGNWEGRKGWEAEQEGEKSSRKDEMESRRERSDGKKRGAQAASVCEKGSRGAVVLDGGEGEKGNGQWNNGRRGDQEGVGKGTKVGRQGPLACKVVVKLAFPQGKAGMAGADVREHMRKAVAAFVGVERRMVSLDRVRRDAEGCLEATLVSASFVCTAHKA